MTHNNIITMQEQYNKTYDTIVIYKKYLSDQKCEHRSGIYQL